MVAEVVQPRPDLVMLRAVWCKAFLILDDAVSRLDSMDAMAMTVEVVDCSEPFDSSSTVGDVTCVDILMSGFVLSVKWEGC